MSADDYGVVVKAYKTPIGQNEKRYNAPTIYEVANIIIGEEFNSVDINSSSQKSIAHTTDCNIQFYFGKVTMDIISTLK